MRAFLNKWQVKRRIELVLWVLLVPVASGTIAYLTDAIYIINGDVPIHPVIGGAVVGFAFESSLIVLVYFCYIFVNNPTGDR